MDEGEAMKQEKEWIGHALALGTVCVWGTTFIATKVLLEHFTAVEILLIRFVLGFTALSIACPKRLRLKDKRHELYFAGAGLTGVLIYYLLENIALGYSTASNIGVVVSCAPMFTAIFWAIASRERLQLHFIIGFAIAISGIAFISFSGTERMQINPIGDVLALAAAVAWGIYSVLIRRLGEFGYPSIAMTRHVFLYGVVFMLPVAWKMGFSPSLDAFKQPSILLTLAFLSFLASAACFVTWNTAVKKLGAIKTSVYIYLSPVITILCAAIVLHERMSARSGLGTVLVLLGLVVSENRLPVRIPVLGKER